MSVGHVKLWSHHQHEIKITIKSLYAVAPGDSPKRGVRSKKSRVPSLTEEGAKKICQGGSIAFFPRRPNLEGGQGPLVSMVQAPLFVRASIWCRSRPGRRADRSAAASTTNCCALRKSSAPRPSSPGKTSAIPPPPLLLLRLFREREPPVLNRTFLTIKKTVHFILVPALDRHVQLMSKYILMHTAHTGACALGPHFSASGFVFCDDRTQLDRTVSLTRAHAPIRVTVRTGRMSAVCVDAWGRMHFYNSCTHRHVARWMVVQRTHFSEHNHSTTEHWSITMHGQQIKIQFTVPCTDRHWSIEWLCIFYLKNNSIFHTLLVLNRTNVFPYVIIFEYRGVFE